MSAAPKPRKLTVAEYLAIENAAERKSEFYDGEMFLMAGASPDHNAIKDNLIVEIGGRLRGSPCRTYSSDQRVKVDATGLFTYPDIVIVCDRPQFDADDPLALTNPVALVEVLSPGTAGYDRGTKFRHYQQMPSVREVVLVSQDRVFVEVFVRQPDGSWRLTVADDPAGELALSTLPVRVPLADVYRGVKVPDRPPLR
ncbi:MAG: Uma2 family endonuclease [Gemmataceae bacterium]